MNAVPRMQMDSDAACRDDRLFGEFVAYYPIGLEDEHYKSDGQAKVEQSEEDENKDGPFALFLLQIHTEKRCIFYSIERRCLEKKIGRLSKICPKKKRLKSGSYPND
jgi:hypothetical protein